MDGGISCFSTTGWNPFAGDAVIRFSGIFSADLLCADCCPKQMVFESVIHAARYDSPAFFCPKRVGPVEGVAPDVRPAPDIPVRCRSNLPAPFLSGSPAESASSYGRDSAGKLCAGHAAFSSWG